MLRGARDRLANRAGRGRIRAEDPLLVREIFLAGRAHLQEGVRVVRGKDCVRELASADAFGQVEVVVGDAVVREAVGIRNITTRIEVTELVDIARSQRSGRNQDAESKAFDLL
jgi:hypothetical protein